MPDDTAELMLAADLTQPSICSPGRVYVCSTSSSRSRIMVWHEHT